MARFPVATSNVPIRGTGLAEGVFRATHGSTVFVLGELACIRHWIQRGEVEVISQPNLEPAGALRPVSMRSKTTVGNY